MRVQIRADVRTIESAVFASRWSLRFPRVIRVRPDKASIGCVCGCGCGCGCVGEGCPALCVCV